MLQAPRERLVRSRQATTASADTPLLIAERYRVEAALGQGGVARVYRVTDTANGRQLALKLLESTASKRLLSLFELEYQTLASLRHPHVVEAYEYGRAASGPYYTMALLEGEDLRTRAPMPWREVLGAMRDAALALGVLHARRFVHRDVSPRNLWRVPDGHVKLIDFGALASFGVADNVIGTPPLLAPEALRMQLLDQRADLYALGATAYYLLTGRHAYPAHELHQLESLWQAPVLPPSAATPANDSPERPPPELDALVLALMHENPLARPSSTADLIDRIDSLLGETAAGHVDTPELHLTNAAFIGRTRERLRLRRLLKLSAAGRGQRMLIHGEPGMGRSKLLQELEVDARLSHATVLHVDVKSFPGMYGTAEVLALKLLDVLSEPARAAAREHATSLGLVGSALRERLDVPADAPPDAPGVLRVRVQSALRDWFLAVAKQHPLVLLLDGLESVDDGSLAFVLALAQGCRHVRLLIAATLPSDRRRVRSAAERALSGISRQLHVAPLTEAETLALLQSIFGQAVHLERLASRLHELARGNPGHVLELAAQLVREEAIGFVNGTWVLPQELPVSLLPRSRDQALAARLEHVSGEARGIARVLSVAPGALDLVLCCVLAERTARELAPLLDQLCEQEILTRSDDGLRFSHEAYRQVLFSELPDDARQRTQRALGQHLLEQSGLDVSHRLRAGVLLLESGDVRGARIVVEASTQITIREPDQLSASVALLERAVVLFRAAGRPEHEQIALLAPLAIAGYFVDQKYAVKYGSAAAEVLQRVLGMFLALRLRRYLGGAVGLLVALTYVTLCHVIQRRRPGLMDSLTLLFMTATALSASSGLCFDYPNTQWAANLLAPFGAFGSTNAAGFSYEVSCGLAQATLDHFSQSSALWVKVIARLSSASPIPGLPDNLRVRYLSGLLFSLGMMESQRDDDRALRAAQRLDDMGAALYPMNTDQLRAMYYGHQGNAKLYRHFRERSEQHAIQQGAIWQNEAWGLLVETIVSHRHRDALAQKRVAEQLRNASKIIPSLGLHADRSRGTYLLMRERYVEALVWLERCLEEGPRMSFAWGRSHGVLARAYNELGRYADARAACRRVLDVFTAGDLEFPGVTLIVETECLVAETGLGQLDESRARLAHLLALHGPNGGPLTLGELYETGVRIALIARDEVGAREHFRGMQQSYGATHIASLVQHCEMMSARIDSVLHRDEGVAALPLSAAQGSDLTSAGTRMAATRDMTFARFTVRILRAIAEQSVGTRGHLYLVDDEGHCSLVQALGPEPPERHVERWLLDRVSEELAEEDTTDAERVDGPTSEVQERDCLAMDGWHHRLHLLWHADATAPRILAAAIIASNGEVPKRCAPNLLHAMATQISQAQFRDPVVPTTSTTTSTTA